MRVFLIGGTGFTGPALIRQLLARGHDVSFLHRGLTHDVRTSGARQFIADRGDRMRLGEAIAAAAPDVVVDLIAFSAQDAQITKVACRRIARRVVVLSSIDVYLAFGRIHGTEPGPPQPTPIVEEAALRKVNHRGAAECDKIAVERSFLEDDQLPATVLRLSAIYGPKDRYRRLRGYLKRMDDGRRAILISDAIASWRFSRAYVDNVAHAIVLAVENERSAGQIYNVAEIGAKSELEFIRAIGQAAGWQGDVRTVPDARLPPYLQACVNFHQDWHVESNKIRSHLGYREVIDVGEAFRRTVHWERANPPQVEPYDCDYALEDEVLAMPNGA